MTRILRMHTDLHSSASPKMCPSMSSSAPRSSSSLRSSIPRISSSPGLLRTRFFFFPFAPFAVFINCVTALRPVMSSPVSTKASPAPSSTCFIAITDAPVNVACAFGRSKAPSAYGAAPLPI